MALVGGDGTDEDKKKAEDFLARNIGIKTSTDVSGELKLTYAITTEDRKNPEVDGSPSSTEKSVQVSLNVSGRADIFTIDNFASGLSADENVASDGGITLIATTPGTGGTYTGITSGGSAVKTSAFDGWIIGIKNPGDAKEDGSYGNFSSTYKGIMLQVGDTLL